MLTIIDRYLIREVLLTLFAVTLVLLVILISNRFARYLAEVVSGTLPADVILTLLGLKVVNYFVLLLPLSLFVSIMLALGRLYKDSEMAALAACGVGTARLYRTQLWLLLPLLALLVWMSLFVAPRTAEIGYEINDQARRSAELSAITPGRFQESADHTRILYVERLSEDRTRMHNVFVQSWRRARPELVTAQIAYQEVDELTGERYLVMEDGYRYEGEPGMADYKIVRFARQRSLLQEPDPGAVFYKRDATPTAALLTSTDLKDTAELQWRLSVPLSALLLGLLAIPLGRTTPRQGRYGRLVAGILIYIIYVNLQGVAQIWVERGQVDPRIGMWWVHGLLLVLIGLSLAQGRLTWFFGRLRYAMAARA